MAESRGRALVLTTGWELSWSIDHSLILLYGRNHGAMNHGTIWNDHMAAWASSQQLRMAVSG